MVVTVKNASEWWKARSGKAAPLQSCEGRRQGGHWHRPEHRARHLSARADRGRYTAFPDVLIVKRSIRSNGSPCRGHGGPFPENEARAERDQRKMAAIWPVDSLRVWKGRFIDPLPGKAVGTPSVCGGSSTTSRRIPLGRGHYRDEGDPVKAPNDGVVILVDNQFFSGNSVVLDHGQGIYTMFFHLSKATVKYGQARAEGRCGRPGGRNRQGHGAHLHWGVRVQGAKVDPLELIKLKLDGTP